MSSDRRKFVHLAAQIVEAYREHREDSLLLMEDLIARGLYDIVAQTLSQVAPAFEQAGHGSVNIDWESIMSVIDIPTLREGWDKG